MISTFEDALQGSTSHEMRALGDPFCLDVLDFCRRILAEPRRIAALKPFATIGSARLYQAMIEANFLIMAIEGEAVGEVAISILFAGCHGRPTPIWNGTDYEALMANVVGPRCQAMLFAQGVE